MEYHSDGDVCLASAHSREIKKIGWKFNCGNVPAAYLTGLLFGKKIKKKITTVYLDIGRHVSAKGSRIFACAKGIADAGVDVRIGKDIASDEQRISGQHIQTYVQQIQKAESQGYQFSHYVKEKLNAQSMSNEFQTLRKKILEKP